MRMNRYLSLIREKRMAVFLLTAWMTVIFAFSSFPGSPVRYELPTALYVERKGAHVLEFFLLTFFAWNAFRSFFPKEKIGFTLLVAGGLSLLYAFLDETHQLFVPGRDGKVTDVLFDGGGILLAALAITVFTGKSKRIRKMK